MQFQRGNVPWTKGQHFSEEHREKIRLSNLGKKRSVEARRNMSAARRGVPISTAHKEHIRAAVKAGYAAGVRNIGDTKGSNNGNWRGGISLTNKTERQLDMQTPQYRTWRRHVFQRDDFRCQACGQYGGRLNADHELPYALYPQLRYEILNGRTLCEKCHLRAPSHGMRALQQL